MGDAHCLKKVYVHMLTAECDQVKNKITGNMFEGLTDSS
jgi:hypothetical protein